MDGYYGNGIDVLVVPQDQEPSDRLPSPNSWSQWGICRPETCLLPYQNILMDEDNISSNSKRNHAQLDIQQADYSIDHDQDVFKKYQPSYQHGPVEEETDNIFLNSLLADLHSFENEGTHKSIYLFPPCNHDGLPADDLWLDMTNSPRFSRNAEQLEDSEEQSLLTSGYLDDGDNEALIAQPNMKDQTNQSLKEVSSSSVGPLVPSGEFGAFYGAIDETPPEELVLQELQMVMKLLPDQTQICFRDALYRLADNSKQRPKILDGHKGPCGVGIPLPWTDEGSAKEAKELSTNVIDRAIANIMFNRIDFNLQEEYSESGSVDLDLENPGISSAQCSGSNQPLV